METSTIISIIGLCITLVFGIINIFYYSQTNKLKKAEIQRQQREEQKQIFDARPRFEIINRNYDENKHGYLNENDDIDCFVAPFYDYNNEDNRHVFKYKPILLNKDEWVSVKFELKNIGVSEIQNLYMAWYSPRDTSLFNVKNDEYITFIEQQFLNYSVDLDQTIKSGDNLTIKINFHKDYMRYGTFTCDATLWLFDQYDKVWMQAFFVNRNRIYDSVAETRVNFRDAVFIDSALKCFENQCLW